MPIVISDPVSGFAGLFFAIKRCLPLLPALLTGCIVVPTGFKSQERVLAKRVDANQKVVEQICEKNTDLNLWMSFTPEGPQTLHERVGRAYYLEVPSRKPTRLKFLEGLGPTYWSRGAALSGTNLWVVVGHDQKSKNRPDGGQGSYPLKLAVFDAHGVIRTRSFFSSLAQFDLDTDNQLLTYWLKEGDYETYSVAQDAVLSEPHAKADSQLRLRIISASTPVVRPAPLEISVELVAEGRTPLAIAQKAIVVRFGWREIKPVFQPDAPPILTVLPGQPLTITLIVPTANLRRGKALMNIGVNCSSYRVRSRREFDYQWLGETHSQRFEIEIEPTPEEISAHERELASARQAVVFETILGRRPENLTRSGTHGRDSAYLRLERGEVWVEQSGAWLKISGFPDEWGAPIRADWSPQGGLTVGLDGVARSRKGAFRVGKNVTLQLDLDRRTVTDIETWPQ